MGPSFAWLYPLLIDRSTVLIAGKVEMQTRNFITLLLLITSIAGISSNILVAEDLPKGSTGVRLISDKNTGTILVDASVNGQPVVMILDTGASHSMFDATIFGLSAMQLQVARMKSRGLGLDADVVWRTADFEIGEEAWIWRAQIL